MLSNLSGAREFVAATRKTGPDDILNSAVAGFGTGALLGRLQGLVLLLSLFYCMLVIFASQTMVMYLPVPELIFCYIC